jgi:hypothetical protein
LQAENIGLLLEEEGAEGIDDGVTLLEQTSQARHIPREETEELLLL